MNDEAAVRLVKYLSAAGVASRRGAGDLVKAGRVKVNGVVVWEPGLTVLPSDRVMLDDVPVGAPEKKHYIMLHKPRNYTCSNHDVHADHLAVELIDLPEPVRLFGSKRLPESKLLPAPERFLEPVRLPAPWPLSRALF